MAKPSQSVYVGTEYYSDILWMTLPLYLMATFFFGPRVLLLALIALITAKLCDWVAALIRSRKYDGSECSSVAFALLIVLMLPATVSIRIVVAAVLIAVLVGKEAFGGYQSYPFHPVAVGFCVVALSWPDEVFRYPMPTNWALNLPASSKQLFDVWKFTGASSTEGISFTLRNGGLPSLDTGNLMLGNYAGPLGITACVVILSCALFLFARKRLPLGAPVAFISAIVLIAFFFPRYEGLSWNTFPFDWQERLQVVKFEVFSGAQLFAAVFLIDEPATLPRNRLSRVIYGVLLGVASMMYRYYGSYALGVCFAILLVNAISGYFDRAITAQVAKRKEAVKQ